MRKSTVNQIEAQAPVRQVKGSYRVVEQGQRSVINAMFRDSQFEWSAKGNVNYVES